MEYPEITQAELHKHLKNIKKNKATGPYDVKGELYRALERSEMCVGKLQTALQNIIDKDLKIKSWEKSYTRLILKVTKPTAKQMRPIALTDVSYKLFILIQLLHDHLIHSCMLAAERTIPFTKPDTKQHRNKAGWNEHVSKEFDHALHWHRLYLQHGRPQSGFIFEMQK